MSIFSDDFNRGDSSTLGNNWVEDVGDWSIDTNRLKAPLAETCYAHNTATPPTADYSVECKIWLNNAGEDMGGVLGRFAHDDQFYLLWFGAGGVLQLYLNDGGYSKLVEKEGLTCESNTWYTIKLEMEGTTLRGYLEGSEEISVVDETITAANMAGVVRANFMEDDIYIDDFVMENVGGLKINIAGYTGVRVF